jgi:zinc/manganese transport system permease protein
MIRDLVVFWPAVAAGLLVAATHVPLGIRVLDRGIVFIDLAVAQIAGLGVIVGDWLGFEHHGLEVQAFALGAALAGALALNLTERLRPEVQEAIIGVVFVLAANAAILLLAANPRGAEHLKDLLVGQVLWVRPGALPVVALASAAILALWYWRGERLFYPLFACAVTLSVQLVGIYLVFATLIVPALATRRVQQGRHALCYALSTAAYVIGLALSTATDLPAGPLVVCTISVLGIALFLTFRQRVPT